MGTILLIKEGLKKTYISYTNASFCHKNGNKDQIFQRLLSWMYALALSSSVAIQGTWGIMCTKYKNIDYCCFLVISLLQVNEL